MSLRVKKKKKVYKHTCIFEPREFSLDNKYVYGKCEECGAINGTPVAKGGFEEIYKLMVQAGHAW